MGGPVRGGGRWGPGGGGRGGGMGSQPAIWLGDWWGVSDGRKGVAGRERVGQVSCRSEDACADGGGEDVEEPDLADARLVLCAEFGVVWEGWG